MNVDIQIESRRTISEVVPTKPYILISITDPDSLFARLPLQATLACKGVLGVKFYDTEFGNTRYAPIAKEQAQLIANFVQTYKDDIELVVVNCDAGISRSSGTAAAISDYLNGDSRAIFSNPKYVPNRTVYNEIRKALGMKHSWEFTDTDDN